MKKIGKNHYQLEASDKGKDYTVYPPPPPSQADRIEQKLDEILAELRK